MFVVCRTSLVFSSPTFGPHAHFATNHSTPRRPAACGSSSSAGAPHGAKPEGCDGGYLVLVAVSSVLVSSTSLLSIAFFLGGGVAPRGNTRKKGGQGTPQEQRHTRETAMKPPNPLAPPCGDQPHASRPAASASPSSSRRRFLPMAPCRRAASRSGCLAVGAGARISQGHI